MVVPVFYLILLERLIILLVVVDLVVFPTFLVDMAERAVVAAALHTVVL
jgi:hypothetical protein